MKSAAPIAGECLTNSPDECKRFLRRQGGFLQTGQISAFSNG
jgi:hypothetical protein